MNILDPLRESVRAEAIKLIALMSALTARGFSRIFSVLFYDLLLTKIQQLT